MLHSYPFSAAVTMFAVVVYWFITMNVGRARGTYKVPAPSTDGPPEFQRRFRAQMNTLEQLVVFLPSLWLFAGSWPHGDLIGAIIGVFWPVGRIFFALGYYSEEPRKRGPGFAMSALSSMILGLGAIAGIVMRLVAE